MTVRAYGWQADGRTIEPSEADEVRRWVAYLLDEDAVPPANPGRLEVELRERGVATVSGGRWARTTIRRCLTAPRMIGHKFDDTGALVETDIAPILDRPTWEAVRAKLLNPEHQKFTPTRDTVWLMSGGLARCAESGHALSYNSDRYGCTVAGGGCGRVSINVQLLDADVTERVLARLTTAQYRRQLGRAMARAGSVEDQRAVLDDLRARLAHLGEDYADRRIERETVHAGTERARANIAQAEIAIRRTAALADLPGPAVEDVLAWWEAAGREQRHDIVAVLLDHVVVRTSEGRTVIGADRLEYHWRKL